MRDTATHLQKRLTAPLTVLAAAFVATGGLIHLREWLDTYRHVPADAAGAAVVRVGFPVNTGLSILVASALLLVCTRRWSRYVPHVIGAAILFQVASLATLIATRTGSVLGWSEPAWTPGAERTRAVEIGALLVLIAVAAVRRERHRSFATRESPSLATAAGR